MPDDKPIQESAAAVAKPRTQKQTRTSRKPKKLPPYNVVLLNDNDHTYEYVIEMLGRLFGFDRNKAFEMAWQVDRRGKVILMTTTKQLATQKRDMIHAYGADWRMERCAGSMTAVVEPAPG